MSTGEESKDNLKFLLRTLDTQRNDNSPYGTFTLAIRDIRDSDAARRYVERYTNLTLDPNSPNYIAKQIGDMYVEWDTNKQKIG